MSPTVGIDLNPDELRRWSREAAIARLELGEWIRQTVEGRWKTAPDPERPCKACGVPLPRGATRRREYHDDACRVAAWRARRRAAHRR